MYYQDQYGYPYQVGYYPRRTMQPQLGAGVSDWLKKAAGYAGKKATGKIVEDIKTEIRSEIRAGMIKMFLAGMAATVAGMFIYRGISGGMSK